MANRIAPYLEGSRPMVNVPDPCPVPVIVGLVVGVGRLLLEGEETCVVIGAKIPGISAEVACRIPDAATADAIIAALIDATAKAWPK